MALRVLFAIAAYYNLNIDQKNVKIAFLYRMIDQPVNVQIPKGSENSTNKKMVCKFLKALYNLKQTLRLWYKWLSSFLLKKLGLKQTNADHSIFVITSGINGLIVSTFVDDIKVMGIKGSGHIEKVMLKLAAAFKMADMGSISFYLRLKVERDRAKKTLKLLQAAYIDKILTKYHFDLAKSCNSPMKEGIPPSNKGSEASQVE